MADKKEYQFPTEEIDLPSKGQFYPKDNPLSSGKIDIKYMTAREEDILTSQNLIRKGLVIDRLLESVIVTPGVKMNEMIIGDKNAPITIIEYASLSCSHCADFHINRLPNLIEEFVDTGKAKIVFRDFPFNYPALLGSMVLRCVPKDIRYEYANAFTDEI